MAKTYLSILFALAALSVLAKDSKIIAQSPGSITFEVDGNLQHIDYGYVLYDGEPLAERIFGECKSMEQQYAEYGDQEYKDSLKYYHIIATSFANEHNLQYGGDSPFYGTLISAYAGHMSVTLSPDMVWLLISQGFARHVNAHAEELRPLLVSHAGKMKLSVRSDDILYTKDADWPKLIGDFASKIDKYTKGDIAHIITADFSTTGPVERVAPQITLMESVKDYFDYVAWTVVCGIPSITLKGTPGDWQRVLEKTKKLSQYGLDEWVKELEPILTEFIRAAEGHPNQQFWQSIVKKVRVDEVRAPGHDCGDESEPTLFDGWFLKLFPDDNGKTREAATMEAFQSERVLVPFLYRIVDTAGNILDQSPMEIWAGFIGTEVDTAANMLTPKIGWMALKGPSDNPKNSKAYLYAVKKNWALSLCLTVMVISLIAFLGWKIIKSRRKAK